MRVYDQFSKNSPLIGILTARRKNGSIAGNGQLFVELQKKLIASNGISFIFTLDGVHEDFIDGFIYMPEKNLWERIIVPFPDLVYNRIPFRKSEQEEQFQLFFSTLKEKGIPFFNPGFIDKYELYRLLIKHPVLDTYIPDTITAKDKQQLLSFVTAHQSIYLKPAQSARGKGIFRLELNSQMHLHLQGLEETEDFTTFDQFWHAWGEILIEKDYLAQVEIKSILFEGKRFDFRILAHADHNHYTVTGVGIRQSHTQEVTTHIPAGGRLLPYQLVQCHEHDEFIQTIVSHIGKALSEQFGYFGEFSIDAGISQSGQYYIYEVNSKPMSFDENEIEERKIAHLCRLFFQLTGKKE